MHMVSLTVCIGQSISWFIPERANSSPISHQLLVVLCLEVGRHEILPFCISMSIDIAIVLACLCSHFQERMFHSRLLVILTLRVFLLPFFQSFSESQFQDLWCRCFCGAVPLLCSVFAEVVFGSCKQALLLESGSVSCTLVCLRIRFII